MGIETENLAGKNILEVGSGRGETTRTLVALLSKFPGTKLTVTDISDTYFQQLQDEFPHPPVSIQYIQTDACSLDGIAPGSIDYIGSLDENFMGPKVWLEHRYTLVDGNGR